MRAGALFFGLVALVAAGCERPGEPPMRPSAREHLPPPPRVPIPEASEAARPSDGAAPSITSIALESSIYEEPRWSSRRLGYLRAGATIPRSDQPVAVNASCAGGWYRVDPRGFLCAGAFASIETSPAVARVLAHTPKTDGLPYLYVLSRAPTPPLYTRVPSRQEQIRFEPDLFDHLAGGAAPGPLPPPDPIPDLLAPGSPSLSLGNDWRSPDRVLAGHARPRSGFALVSTFDEAGRRFGLTTSLEVIPLDRTKAVKESAFSGLALDDEITLPVAFVRAPGAFTVKIGEKGLEPAVALEYRSAVPIVAERKLEDQSYAVLKDNSLVRSHVLTIVRPMKHLPAWATGDAKWIEVSIPRQTLVAYEGAKPVYVTMVSTGIGGTGDPETEHATIQGIFSIYEKHLAVTMDGHESSDAFDLRDVPYVQYFHEGFALHAAYWHDDFGRPHSHGCVNLSPKDAAWLFKWTDPHLPDGWHGVTAKVGTTVYVHD